MELSIRSKILGRTLTFTRPGSSYIYVDLNGHSGTLGVQICEGGSTTGWTLSYEGNDQKEFERICRRWYRANVNYHKKWAMPSI